MGGSIHGLFCSSILAFACSDLKRTQKPQDSWCPGGDSNWTPCIQVRSLTASSRLAFFEARYFAGFGR